MVKAPNLVVRYSKRGHPYFVLEPDVPRIPDDLLNSVAYLYPSEAEAEDGSSMGGTGFFVGVGFDPHHPALELLCLVTNKHVVHNGSATARINTPDGKFDIIPLDGAQWHYHPDGDDIAVCPVGINTTFHKIRSVNIHALLSKQLIDDYDLGVGDDVFIIGRFISREGKARNIPSVRFGVLAQMPDEPIVLDGGLAQESFLIEARSIPGYSGSPVFLMIPPSVPNPWRANPNLNEETKTRLPELMKMMGYNPKRQTDRRLGPWLVGIDYCHIFNKEQVFNSETGDPIPNMHVRSNTGMMGVVPAWRLADILGGPGIMAAVDHLKEAVERGKKKQDQASLDSASEAPFANDENPAHREDFDRLLSAAALKNPDQSERE